MLSPTAKVVPTNLSNTTLPSRFPTSSLKLDSQTKSVSIKISLLALTTYYNYFCVKDGKSNPSIYSLSSQASLSVSTSCSHNISLLAAPNFMIASKITCLIYNTNKQSRTSDQNHDEIIVTPVMYNYKLLVVTRIIGSSPLFVDYFLFLYENSA